MLIRERLQQQDKLILLNTTSLRLIPLLSERSDLDGLIHFSIDEIKRQGFMTEKLVPAALEGLEKIGWLRKGVGGRYYSMYTCHTTPENKGFYYINQYKLFQKDVFKKMYKRRINLLYYILTAKIPGEWHYVMVEKLYKNKAFMEQLAISYFDDFDDLMNNLIPLIEAQIIEVRLGRGKEATILTGKTAQLRERIYTFCGKEQAAKRKKRMSSKKNHHSIGIRISNEVIKDKTTIYDVDRRSTLRDLEEIAEEYGYSLDVFSEDSLKEVHMMKHKIHKEFGNIGISIYRESLRAFFQTNDYAFSRLMNNGEFGKIIHNYYVIPRIKIELTHAIEQAATTQNLSKTEAFLRYFTNEAYPDDLVLFDYQMIHQFSHVYEWGKQTSDTWKQFADKVESIYQHQASLGYSAEIVLQFARERELCSKKRLESELKQKTKTEQKSISNSGKPEESKYVQKYYDMIKKMINQGEIKEIHCDF